jgi:hypothetical protein
MYLAVDASFASNLATGASALVSIGIAMLAFLVPRMAAPTRRALGGYAVGLVGIGVLGVYTAGCDALAWWAWARSAANNPELLFGWSLHVWLIVLFLVPGVFSFGVAVSALALLFRQVRRRIREGNPP